MIPYKLAITLLVLAFSPSLLLAQSSPSLSDGAKNDLRTTTNAIAVLAGNDSLSAGTFKFKNDTSPDVYLDLFKVLGELPLGEADDQFVPLIEISPALLSLEQNFRDAEPMGSAEADSWSLGAGVGLRMQFFDKILEVTPRFKVEYSEIDYDLSIDGIDDGLIDQIIPDIDAWSYIPSVEANVRQEVFDDGGSAIFNTQISYVYVDASTSGDSVNDFSDDSWVWRNSIAFEQPVSLGENSREIFVAPHIGRVDIHGAARNGFDFNNFYEFGLDISSHSIAPNYFREIGFGFTYAYEREFQGWRFGFFGELA